MTHELTLMRTSSQNKKATALTDDRFLTLYLLGEPRRTRTYNPLIKSQRVTVGVHRRWYMYGASRCACDGSNRHRRAFACIADRLNDSCIDSCQLKEKCLASAHSCYILVAQLKPLTADATIAKLPMKLGLCLCHVIRRDGMNELDVFRKRCVKVAHPAMNILGLSDLAVPPEASKVDVSRWQIPLAQTLECADRTGRDPESFSAANCSKKTESGKPSYFQFVNREHVGCRGDLDQKLLNLHNKTRLSCGGQQLSRGILPLLSYYPSLVVPRLLLAARGLSYAVF